MKTVQEKHCIERLSQKLRHFRGSRFSQCLYYQQLHITHYQVRFYANNYSESLPIVSTAFKPKLRKTITGLCKANDMYEYM